MNVEKISRFYKRIPRSKEAYSRLIRKTFNVPGKLSGFQNAILFGAENLGKKTLASFRKKGINILAFSDNDKNKWGSLVENVPVIPPRSIKYQPYSFVIITSKYVKEIHTQLRKEKARGILPHYVLSVLFPNVFPDVFYPTCFAKIMRQRPKVTEAYRALSGSKSKKLFLQLLEFMIFLLPEDIPSPEGGQYFPEELPLLKDNETYVDVGAFTGDTLKVFLSRTGGRFHKYIALEPDKDNFRKLVNGIPRLYKDKIICIRAAA